MSRRSKPLGFSNLFVRYWLPAALYVAVIFTLSAQQHLRPPLQFENSDKMYHLLEYFGLGILLGRAMRGTLRNSSVLVTAFLALSLGIVVGTSDECFQSFVPGRECSAFDLMADTAGLAIAQLALLAFVRA